MAHKDPWSPLESDPNCLNKFLKKLGQQKLNFVDVLGFEEEALAFTPQPVYALLLIYPLGGQQKNVTKDEENVVNDENVWFIKQTIPNSCGTIALLHILGNLSKKFPLDENSVADLFFKKVHGMNPDERAEELEKNIEIQKLHKEFAEPGITVLSDLACVDTHFTVFLEENGQIFELDGRKKRPISHGATTADTLLKDCAKVIENVYMSTGAREHRFAVLALTGDYTV